MSNDFQWKYWNRTFDATKDYYLKIPYPLAVVSRTSEVDDLLNWPDFENIHKMTM